MTRLPTTFAALGAAVALFGCGGPDAQSPAAPLSRGVSPQLTSQPAQARLLGRKGELIPLLSVGDSLPPAGAAWAPVPDGLGGYQSGGDLILFANHELTSGGVKDSSGATQYPYARVSRLVLDTKTLAVKDASYVVNGSEQYQRLCSATFVDAAQGFPSGYFFTGEENTGGTHDGIQLAIGKDGAIHELPWLGRYAHENLTAVPYAGHVVAIGTDDTRGASELYMYVGSTEADLINGTGKLYVFSSSVVSHAGYLKAGEPISGTWVEVPNPASLSSAQLQAAVTGLGAFPFVRLEDSDYDRRATGGGGVYFVDTGSESVACGAAPCDAYGSIYRLQLNRLDPTGPARLVLITRSNGALSGWSSPDNIAATSRSLMVQEDPANSTFAGQRAPRIYRFGYSGANGLTRPESVVALENPTCDDVRGTCWESSGIIDASAWFGPGSWLFDVQAHTLPVANGRLLNEGGQLLLLRLPGS